VCLGWYSGCEEGTVYAVHLVKPDCPGFGDLELDGLGLIADPKPLYSMSVLYFRRCPASLLGSGTLVWSHNDPDMLTRNKVPEAQHPVPLTIWNMKATDLPSVMA
jgi:hypothetical protein